MGPIHHERRLHQLMLADEHKAWKHLARLQKQASLPFPSNPSDAAPVDDQNASLSRTVSAAVAAYQSLYRQGSLRLLDSIPAKATVNRSITANTDSSNSSSNDVTTAGAQGNGAFGQTVIVNGVAKWEAPSAAAATAAPGLPDEEPITANGMSSQATSARAVSAATALADSSTDTSQLATAGSMSGPQVLSATSFASASSPHIAPPPPGSPQPALSTAKSAPLSPALRTATNPASSTTVPHSPSSVSSVPPAQGRLASPIKPTPPDRSPKHSEPEVTIQHSSLFNYWLVTIKCKDRNKLFFDTVCTLSDMRYDVYHGTIDNEADMASQLFYVRPR